MEQEFNSPFDFFQAFGDYWEGQGWQKIGHQLEDLFTRLHSFLKSRRTPHMDVVLGLMKLDYFLGHKYKPRKIWWEDPLQKDQWAGYMKTLAERPEDVRLPRIAGASGTAWLEAAVRVRLPLREVRKRWKHIKYILDRDLKAIQRRGYCA